MSDLLSDRPGRKARKSHRCCLCGDGIPAGSIYDYRTGTVEGDFFEMHMHPECNAYAHANWDSEWEHDLSEPVFERPKPDLMSPLPRQVPA